jgi:hypothetical protein
MFTRNSELHWRKRTDHCRLQRGAVHQVTRRAAGDSSAPS